MISFIFLYSFIFYLFGFTYTGFNIPKCKDSAQPVYKYIITLRIYWEEKHKTNIDFKNDFLTLAGVAQMVRLLSWYAKFWVWSPADQGTYKKQLMHA